MCKALEDIYNDGVQAGIEAGIKQGRESGIAQGEEAHKKDVAFQMQKLGYPLEAIAAVLRETVEGISKILAVVR